MSTNLALLFDQTLGSICFRHVFVHFTLEDLFRFRAVSRQTFRLVTEYFLQIDRINLANMKKNKFTWYIFSLLVRDNVVLQELNLTNCKWVNESRFNDFVQHQTRLRSVNLSSCYSVSNTTLTNLAMFCPFIETLVLQNCYWLNNEALFAIAAQCSCLVELDVTSCWNLTDHSVKVLFQKRGSSIRRLVLSHIYSLGDLSMAAIQTWGTVLTFLDISFCWRVTDNGMRILSKSNCLERVALNGCSAITSLGFRYLNEHQILVIQP